MSFTLQVQFTGLCLYVVHEDGNSVAVVMPDGRYKAGVDAFHPDMTQAVPHVGYLRFDLANLNVANNPVANLLGTMPNDSLHDNGPPLEVVHRFHGQTMRLGIPRATTKVSVQADVPQLGEFAPMLELHPDVFSLPPVPTEDKPQVVLFRTVLEGGRLETEGTSPETWSIERRLLGGEHAPVVRAFRGDVVWTREIKGTNDMTLTLTDFDGSNPIEIPLRAGNDEAKNYIRIKIANLCSENPLEWDEYQIHSAGIEDSDFKWIYSLFTPPQGQRWDQLLDGFLLPAPRLARPHGQGRGYPTMDCSGGMVTRAFAPIDTWSVAG